MYTKVSTIKKSPEALLGWSLLLIFIVVTFLMVILPIGILWAEELRQTFYFTLTPADLDGDGDLDVLVHGMRRPGEFEAFSGAALWINQGGMQGGQPGQFLDHLNDIQGGRDSTPADLDGDGDLDVLNYDGFRLVLGLNQGGKQGGQPGVFQQYTSVAPPNEAEHRYDLITQFGTVLSGDLNTDGKTDALILGCCGRAFTFDPDEPDNPNISWVWFYGTDELERIRGTVASLDALEALPVAEAALADLDGDADLDLFAVILPTPSGVGAGPTSMVLFNDGAGSFSDSGQRLGAERGSSLALGDVDGDGDLDALVGHARGGRIWINQGGAQSGQAGQFAPATDKLSGSQTLAVRLADLDMDGDLDILIAGKRGARVWWNDGAGRFAQGAQKIPFSKRKDLTTGDFNGDGMLDIFIAEYSLPSQVWLNDGNGTFVP